MEQHRRTVGQKGTFLLCFCMSSGKPHMANKSYTPKFLQRFRHFTLFTYFQLAQALWQCRNNLEVLIIVKD